MAELLQTDPATLRRSPLAHLTDRMRAATATGDRAVSLTELPFLTMVGIRVAPDSDAAARIGAALGAGLPPACGQTRRAGAHTVLWLGPDEWLVVSTDAPEALVRSLQEALGGDPGSVVDLSANRTVLELAGPSARPVLEKGCPVDLHPGSFTPATAVATTLGPVPVLLWQVADASYRLLPRSSFAGYVARWLLDAMGEYAVPEVP